ncbi:MAG: tetratricopeptide repeat protein [Candidatus Binataceae bacterium]
MGPAVNIHATRWGAAPAILLALLLGGCAPQQSPAVAQLSNNQFTMRGMIASQNQQIDAMKAQVSRMQDQIDELHHGGGANQLKSINQRLSTLESEVRALQSGASAPPGSVPGASGTSTNPFGPAGTAPPPSAAAGTIAPPPAGAAPPPGAPAAAAPNWRDALTHETVRAKSSSAPGASLFRKGLAEMKAGHYRRATGSFSDLMHRYPKSPLSEPAEYFSANALYETGKYDQAILQFNDLAMRFPNGRFAGPALLREAQAFLKINDRIDARLTLQKLINDHSGTAEASVANDMMKTLVSGQAPVTPQ